MKNKVAIVYEKALYILTLKVPVWYFDFLRLLMIMNIFSLIVRTKFKKKMAKEILHDIMAPWNLIFCSLIGHDFLFTLFYMKKYNYIYVCVFLFHLIPRHRCDAGI